VLPTKIESFKDSAFGLNGLNGLNVHPEKEEIEKPTL